MGSLFHINIGFTVSLKGKQGKCPLKVVREKWLINCNSCCYYNYIATFMFILDKLANFLSLALSCSEAANKKHLFLQVEHSVQAS